MLVASSIFGVLFGYISGMLVGGVFMAAEFIRHRLARIGGEIDREAAGVIEDTLANSDDLNR